MEKGIYKRNDSILANEVGGEMVMMSIEDGKYYGLNKTGLLIWNMLETPKSFDDICKSLSDLYQIPLEKCAEEVIPFIEEMIKEKIIYYN